MKKLLILVLVLCLSCCLFVIAKEKEYTKEEIELYKKQMEKWIADEYCNFIIEGVVVDENGKPLDNVGMEIEKSRFTGWGKYDETKKKIVVNKNFSIIGQRLSSIYVDVVKKGYYREHLSFLSKGWKGAEVRGKTLIDKNVKIVLHKIGQIAKLSTHEGFLSFDKKGKVMAINLMSPKRYTRNADTEIQNIFDKNSIPAHCVYITADLNKKRQIAMIKQKWSKGRERGNLKNIVKAVHLCLSDSDGGFIPYNPPNINRKEQYMKEAPEDGYQSKLIFNADNPEFEGCHYLYFYFKSNGKYGKGCINAPWYKSDDSKVELHITLMINLTGSRNVTTP